MRKILKVLFLFLIVVISGILLSGCTPSEEQIKQYSQYMSEADLLIGGKEYNLALEKLSTATELLPSKGDAYSRITDIFIAKNRLEDATKILDESATKIPDSERAVMYGKVGDAYYMLNDFEKALYTYQLGKGFDGSNMDINLGIAKVYIQKGNIEGAKKLLEERYDQPLYIESQLILSYVYSLTDLEKALEVVKDIEPGEEWREKYVVWKEVLDSLTDDELFNSTKLSKVYIDEGYPYLAIALLEPKNESMSEYVDGIYMLGKAYYENKQYQKSIDLLESNMFLSDLNQYIYWILARDYYMLDDIDTSFSYYDTAISYGGDNADEDLYKEYFDLLIQDDLTEKALEVTDRAEGIFDGDWISLQYMNLYSLREDTQRFEYYMENIEYEDLDSTLKGEYLTTKIDYLIQNSLFDDAKRSLDLFWDLDQYDPRYNFLYAKLSFEEGDLENARKYCKKAIEYDTTRVVTDEAQKLLAQID